MTFSLDKKKDSLNNIDESFPQVLNFIDCFAVMKKVKILIVKIIRIRIFFSYLFSLEIFLNKISQ